MVGLLAETGEAGRLTAADCAALQELAALPAADAAAAAGLGGPVPHPARAGRRRSAANGCWACSTCTASVSPSPSWPPTRSWAPASWSAGWSPASGFPRLRHTLEQTLRWRADAIKAGWALSRLERLAGHAGDPRRPRGAARRDRTAAARARLPPAAAAGGRRSGSRPARCRCRLAWEQELTRLATSDDPRWILRLPDAGGPRAGRRGGRGGEPVAGLRGRRRRPGPVPGRAGRPPRLPPARPRRSVPTVAVEHGAGDAGRRPRRGAGHRGAATRWPRYVRTADPDAGAELAELRRRRARPARRSCWSVRPNAARAPCSTRCSGCRACPRSTPPSPPPPTCSSRPGRPPAAAGVACPGRASRSTSTVAQLRRLGHRPDGPAAGARARIEVTHPAPLLQYVSLLDTPGVGGLDPAHATVALDAVERATALLFVADASAPLSQPELDFLVAASERVDAVVFALTKVDAYPGWRRIADDNRALLRAHAPRFADAPWFPVSARLAELALDGARRRAGRAGRRVADRRAAARPGRAGRARSPAAAGQRAARRPRRAGPPGRGRRRPGCRPPRPDPADVGPGPRRAGRARRPQTHRVPAVVAAAEHRDPAGPGRGRRAAAHPDRRGAAGLRAPASTPPAATP